MDSPTSNTSSSFSNTTHTTAAATPLSVMDTTITDTPPPPPRTPAPPPPPSSLPPTPTPSPPHYRDPICPTWTKCTQTLHGWISGLVTMLALHAVRNPKTYIATISCLSVILITVGFLTNFTLVLDLDDVLTPVNSKPQQHADWIYSSRGFPDQTRLLQMVFHNNGANILHVSQARRVLEAVDVIRTTSGYDELCSRGVYQNFNNIKTCRIFSMSGSWENHSLELFDATVQTDDDLLNILSHAEFADGSPVIHDTIVGNYHYVDNNHHSNYTTPPLKRILTTAQSYLIRLELPDKGSDTNAFERDMLGRLDSLRRQWMKQDSAQTTGVYYALQMDFVTIYAYQIEFLRAIIGDLYLVALSALLMVGFTCCIFYRKDAAESRCLLGIASVVTIGCSILTGNGLMFICGVPYSTVHQMLPFIIFGIGLDDTFIITGAYFRTADHVNVADNVDGGGNDHKKMASSSLTTSSASACSSSASSAETTFNMIMEERIRQTMQEVGWSITLTTLTTVFAFTLGYFSSSFPGVHWLCLSACTTIFIDFYYQITYFVALLVLDERRIQAQKRDCCFWLDLKSKDGEEGEDVDDHNEEEFHPRNTSDDSNDHQGKEGKKDCQVAEEEEEDSSNSGEGQDTMTKVLTSDNETSSEFEQVEAGGTSPPTVETANQQQMVVCSKVPLSPSEVIKPGTNNKPTTSKAGFGVVDEGPDQHPSTEELKTDAAAAAEMEIDNRPLPEKLMSWYADLLLKPYSKVFVLIMFGLFFVNCCFSAKSMTQEFDVGSYVTEDSYLRNIFTSLNEYSTVVRPMALYFRNIDQSTPDMQQQMIDYVTEMEELPQVWSAALDDSFVVDDGSGNITTTALDSKKENGFSTGLGEQVPPFCWVRDLQELDRYFEDQPVIQSIFNDMSFNEKIDFLLKDKILREVYGQDIVRDGGGNVVASRCYLFLQDLDLKDVEAQIDMLFDQRDVTLAQPINQQEGHEKDWAFFAYDELFGYWEAYSVSVDELVFTMIAGVVAVTFIAFVFIPHWTGAVLVCPLIIILYINMLGSLNCLGLHINGITYVCVVVSIGLLVDFLIHVLLRYYECSPGKTRDERVKETLETMGASILVGGITTFLAVVPIAASSVKIFLTVFNSFFAMVGLGVTHGLILLPVILSMVGPTTNVRQLGVGQHGGNEDEKDRNHEIDKMKQIQGKSSSVQAVRTLAYGDFDGHITDEIDVDTLCLRLQVNDIDDVHSLQEIGMVNDVTISPGTPPTKEHQHEGIEGLSPARSDITEISC